MRSTLRRRIITPLAVLSIAGIALAGCSSTGSTGSGGGDDNTVTVYGTIADNEAKQLEASWADWATENDITVKYESSKEFESQIGIRAQGGNPPDVAIFPQPGLLGDLAKRGYIKEATDEVKSNIDEYWSKDWKAYGTVDGTVYGAPLMASVKGFVWYSPKQFTEWGVAVPKTWDELLAVTKTIQEKTGTAPWCAGFGSGDASGWPGTDWVEDLVLRQSGADVYDQWVNHEIEFTDDKIKDAFDAVGTILKDPKYVNAGFGDVSSINSTEFTDIAPKLVDGTCALHHQASFYSGNIEDAGANVAEDGDIWAFVTPGIEEGSNAVTGGGEIVGAFSDSEATQKFTAYLSSPEWANSRVKLGGVISANNGLDPANASTPLLAQAITILQDPNTTFRFDASDLMPGAVGAGTFWKGMVNWINGSETDQVLSEIEAGWPSE